MTAHPNVAAALAAAQGAMKRAVKDTSNPHFKSKYADLASVMDACMTALTTNGIAVVQPIAHREGEMYVETELHHGASGTILSDGGMPLIVNKRDMQGLGSALTYARRYGLMSMAGIAADDDDGNAAAAAAPPAADRPNPVSEGLKDAWLHSVLDSLPRDANPRIKAEAFADAICRDFAGKKAKALDNSWDRRKAIIDGLQDRHPDLYQKVAEVYDLQRAENDAPEDPSRLAAQ